MDSVEQTIDSEDRVRVTVEVGGESRSVEIDDDARVQILPESDRRDM